MVGRPPAGFSVNGQSSLDMTEALCFTYSLLVRRPRFVSLFVRLFVSLSHNKNFAKKRLVLSSLLRVSISFAIGTALETSWDSLLQYLLDIHLLLDMLLVTCPLFVIWRNLFKY